MNSNNDNSNENSLIFDKQNSETPHLNSRMSNLAEPSFSNEDHDDSLYDALSIDTQAPFKVEIQSNPMHQSGLTKDNINILNNYGDNSKSQNTNRFSLVDLEYIKNDKEPNQFQSQMDHTDLMLDLKDTSIDEILLIADEIQSSRDKQLISKKSEKLNLHENSKNLNNFENKTKKNFLDTSRNRLNSNDEKDANFGSNQDEKSKTNLQRLKERIGAIDLYDKRLDDGLEIMKTPQPELVNDDFINEAKEKLKNKGAFKLYTTNISDNELSPNSKLDKNEKINYRNPSSFCHLDRQSIKSSDVLNKSKRGPIKKYRSGSATNLTFEKNLKKTHDGKKFNNKQNTERIRPATHNEITYTLDSDESTIIDNLIKNPDRLKQKLKQSRIERDQLNQLQQNYTRLLQQYAEAENFIDAFRLNAQIGGSSSNPTPVAKGSFLTNESKSQTNVGSQPNFNQPSIICSSNSTLSSIQVNIEKNNSLNGSKTVLVTDQTNPLVKSVSLTKAQSNDNLTKYKEFPFQSQSANNFHPSQDLKKNSSQSTVYVIPNKKISNTGPETKSPTIDENSRVNTPLEDNIVIDQTSTLGILVQIKVLEDKMQSFVTLVNENQLNKSEQRQVFDSIQNDYQIIIQNFDLLKTSNSESLIQQQIEMDVDLSKELGKMKTLLDNIVHKMNDNLIDATSDYSDLDQKQSFENTTAASFDDNRDELMGQYNRLLDFFNDEQEDINKNHSKIDKFKEEDQIRSETVCSVSKEFDSESSFYERPNTKNKIEKDQITNLSEPSETTNEINEKILTNNARLICNRTKKEMAENKNNLNKKLSRLSVNRVDKIESQDSDKNNAKNVKKTSINENINRNLNNNRRLTRMSNESSTETLTTSDNESTKIFSDQKPSFKNYIDEITDDSMAKSKQINHKNYCISAEEERNRYKKKFDDNNQPKIKSKVIINGKKREYVKQNVDTQSEIEYSDQNTTVRQKNDVRPMKPSPSSKKSLSIGNIYENSKYRKNEKKSDLRHFPIARAYEGSDSLEDLDSSMATINDNLEYASSTVVKYNDLKKSHRSDKRTEYAQILPIQSHKPSLIDDQKRKIYEKKSSINYQQVPRMYHSKKKIDESAILASDVDSVVKKRNALKNSKKDLMKKLTEEVEFLKQEILKKNAKCKTSDEKIQHMDFTNSDSRNKEYDSQLTINKEDNINNCALKPLKMNNLAQKVIKHKNSVHIHPRVLVKNNKNILVLKNKHGKEQHFYVIEQNELDRQSARKLKTLPYESIVSNIDHDFMNVPTVKSTDYQDVKNYKFSSVQNLFNLKREDKFLDDYFTDEELENNFFTDKNFLSNRARSHSTRDRRYLSTNDIFERKSSNRRNGCEYYLSKCSKSFSRDRANYPLNDYSIHLKKENDKSSQIPIVVGKPINRKSRDCLIFLPVNNSNVVNKVPVNFVPYSIKENKEDSDYEIDNSVKNLIHSRSTNRKYSPNQQKYHVIDKPNVSTVHDSNESSTEKKTRKIRYYIREYTDISTVSDNENMYRANQNDDVCEKKTQLNADFEILVDRAMAYAHCISSNAKRIRNKLTLFDSLDYF